MKSVRYQIKYLSGFEVRNQVRDRYSNQVIDKLDDLWFDLWAPITMEIQHNIYVALEEDTK